MMILKYQAIVNLCIRDESIALFQKLQKFQDNCQYFIKRIMLCYTLNGIHLHILLNYQMKFVNRDSPLKNQNEAKMRKFIK